jgi:hypothetical protein
MTMMIEAKRSSSRASGVSNVAFDLLTILENKLKGIAAMEEYKIDCLEADDRQALELIEQLQRIAGEDAARLKELLKARI